MLYFYFFKLLLMKNAISLLFLIMVCNISAQDAYTKGIMVYQYEQNLKFHNKEVSPLSAKDLKNFSALHFYKIDEKFKVTAKLVKEKEPIIFEMQTTTSRKPLYIKYGTLTFTIDGKEQTLTIYQNKDFGRAPQYKDYLFLPFTDKTSGIESYGGGRYLDVLTTDENTDGTITIDFNKSYNPYCAYNSSYSCPLTPKENTVSIALKAGVKVYKKH
jgi:uncharacterized protein (DUF1684 family)